jgi:two-component system response regulator WspF
MRIAIVNDVMIAVEAMRRIVAGLRDHQVAWIARDGAEAVALCARDTPDLILMDLIMPGLDGVEATRRIMTATPCAIVIVTASVGGNSAKVFEAMGAGALDAVNTPILERAGAEGARPLLAKIETIRRLLGPGGRKPGGRLTEPFAGRRPLTRSPAHPLTDVPSPPRSHSPRLPPACLIAIGASAGGPAALAKVLAPLPADLAAAIVIIQHVDVQFVGDLADWLSHQTALRLRLARDGDAPQAQTVFLAAKEEHLVLSGPMRLSYTDEPLDAAYSPSVDVFFKSAARYWLGDVIGLLLTGMGRDGAEGLQLLRREGHHTVAQDRATSAVYGMPKAALELHAASEVLPLDQIGPRLAQLVAERNVHV